MSLNKGPWKTHLRELDSAPGPIAFINFEHDRGHMGIWARYPDGWWLLNLWILPTGLIEVQGPVTAPTMTECRRKVQNMRKQARAA